MNNFKNMNLPRNFTYYPVACDENESIFRIKEIKDEEAALMWLAKFSDETKTRWRKSKTYPRSGLQNVYKVDLRCVHNTDRRVTGTGPSKHTGCKAQLHITIKRVIRKSKAKTMDNLIKEYPTIIVLKKNHNHDLNDVPKNRLTPLRRRALPSKGKEGKQNSNTTKPIKNEEDDNSSAASGFANVENEHGSDEEPSLEGTQTFEEDDSSDEELSPEELIRGLDNIFRRIKEGTEKNPCLFVPAILQLLSNVDKYVHTDFDLALAMSNFGLPTSNIEKYFHTSGGASTRKIHCGSEVPHVLSYTSGDINLNENPSFGNVSKLWDLSPGRVHSLKPEKGRLTPVDNNNNTSVDTEPVIVKLGIEDHCTTLEHSPSRTKIGLRNKHKRVVDNNIVRGNKRLKM